MRFIVETNKSKDEILQIIRDNTYIKTSVFDFPKGDKYFEGSVSENSFKICRCIHYRNSFLPLIIGTIEAHEYGSTINIRMRMAIPVIVFFSYMVYRRTCRMFNSSIHRISYAGCFSPLYHACFWDFACHNPK